MADQALTDDGLDAGMMELIRRLDRDLRDASRLLGRKEARYLTDRYYQIQEFRKASAYQVRSADAEPNRVLAWVFESMRRMEDNVKRSLGEFTGEYRVGAWLQSLTGIGPVLSAGFLSHLDVRKAPTAGHFWRFAGLDPTVAWGKGQKRPWNARLKVLCFKAEDCFVKFCNHKNDHYGRLYLRRKEYEQARNDRGELADQARAALEKKNFGKETDARKHYEAGKLPPAHVHARAMRWTGKIFLSHLHHVMYVDYYGEEPPVPYAFEKCPGDHRHYVPIPNYPWDKPGKGLADMGE